MAVIPRYISLSYVKNRLYNKVNFLGNTTIINAKFADSDTNVGLSDDATSEFINEAASFVEFVLSPLYLIPFRNIDGIGDYTTLPSSTRDFLNNLIWNRAASLILQTEFAKDTGVKGDNFIKQLEDQWQEYINNRLLKRSDEGKYQYPPLLNLATNGNQYDLSAPMSAPVTMTVGKYDALEYANRHINDPARKLFYPYYGGSGFYGNGYGGGV